MVTCQYTKCAISNINTAQQPQIFPESDHTWELFMPKAEYRQFKHVHNHIILCWFNDSLLICVLLLLLLCRLCVFYSSIQL